MIADAVLRACVTLFDHLRCVVGIGDDAVAPRHDAVISGLERTDLAIGSVIGGDERLAHAPRRDQRAPSWRPAPRMDEIDAMLPDQLGEAADIGKYGERGFARNRERHDIAAHLTHLRGHAASFGGDQRRGTRPGERLRDLDGRQFASPGIEARHHLKYGHHE